MRHHGDYLSLVTRTYYATGSAASGVEAEDVKSHWSDTGAVPPPGLTLTSIVTVGPDAPDAPERESAGWIVALATSVERRPIKLTLFPAHSQMALFIPVIKAADRTLEFPADS